MVCILPKKTLQMTKIHRQLPMKILSSTQSLMLHALGFVTGDTSIRISYPFLFHPGVQVTVTEPGEAKWIYMMLPVTRGSLITDINIAHHRTGLESRISIIRLIEQREPIVATVVHDGAIEKTVPSTCVVSTSCRVVVNRSILLKVCMDFADSDDMIELGSVEVRYVPEYASLPEAKKKEIEGKYIREESLAGLFNSSHSLNVRRPSFVELFLQKTRKKKSVPDSKIG